MNLKQNTKALTKLLFLLIVLPLYLLFILIATSTRSESSFKSFSQALSLVPGLFGVYMRAAFYKLACPNTSDDISVGFLTILSHRDTTIERGVYIGPQCNIGKCTIGENTLLGSGVHILSGSKQHNFEDPSTPIQEQGGSYEKIRIGKDCWLGNQSLVMDSVGDKSIVASGSVVTKEIEGAIIVAGNPAKKIRERFSNDGSAVE